MQRSVRLYRVASVAILLTGLVSAQGFIQNLGGQRVGTSVFPFLKIETSVPGAALSGASVALATDASSLFYNPAIITQLPGLNLVATNIQWPADIRYNAFVSTLPVGRRSYIGIFLGVLQTPPMQETTEYYPFGTGREFLFRDQLIGMTYSLRMTDKFSFGTTAKYVSETLADISMDAVLLDFGTYYITGFRSLRISSSFTNFGDQVAPDGTYLKEILHDQTGEAVIDTFNYQAFSPPTTFRLGAAYNLIEGSGQTLTLAVQLTNLADNAENYAVALDYHLGRVLKLRGGYHLNSDEFGLSFGIGLLVPLSSGRHLHIDYAYTDAAYLTSPQRIAVGIRL